MKAKITVGANQLMPGAGEPNFDDVRQIEIDLGKFGGFSIVPYLDGVKVLAHGSLIIMPMMGNEVLLRASGSGEFEITRYTYEAMAASLQTDP